MNLKEVKTEEIIRKLPKEIILEKDVIKNLRNLHLYTLRKSSQLKKAINQEKQKEKKLKVNKKINQFSEQLKSLKERKMVTYYLYCSLKNYLSPAPQQRYEFPKILSIEKNHKASFILDTGQKLINFNEETLNLLVEAFYPWGEVSLKQKQIKNTLLKEKREIVLKI